MTEQIRALLDAAVEEVRPTAGDPAPEMIRRGRVAQRRSRLRFAAAGVTALAVMVTGGLAVTGRWPVDRGAPEIAGTSAPTKRLPKPRMVLADLVDGEVRVGGLTMPVPAGWQVVKDRSLLYCQIPDRSVLINVTVSPGGDCNVQAHVQFLPWAPTVLPLRMTTLPPGFRGRGLNEVVLPGGQPAWFEDNELSNARAAAKSRGAYLEFQTPWAGSRLYVEMPTDFDRLTRSIRTEPVTPARLSLPDKPAGVDLEIPGGTTLLRTADQQVTNQVIERLAALDRVVGSGELPCAGAPNLIGDWQLAGTKMAMLNVRAVDGSIYTTIALSTSADCAFATSSLGGRVWLPPGFVNDLSRLLSTAPIPGGAPND